MLTLFFIGKIVYMSFHRIFQDFIAFSRNSPQAKGQITKRWFRYLSDIIDSFLRKPGLTQ